MCYISHNTNHSLATKSSRLVRVRWEKYFQADTSLQRDALLQMLPCWSCRIIVSLTETQLPVLCFDFRRQRREYVRYVACLEWRWWVIWRISKEEPSSLTPVKWLCPFLKCLFVLFLATKEFVTSGITREHYTKQRDSKKAGMQVTWKAHPCARQPSWVCICKAARVHHAVEKWMCAHKPQMCLGVILPTTVVLW